MTTKLSRREFIKITSAGLGAFALPGCFLKDALNLSDNRSGKERITPTYCEICFWKCAGWVHARDNKPWKIIGNERDLHSQGRMCTRGTGGLGAYTDPERLQTPLIRTEKRGQQVFRQASWEEALDYVAEKLKAIAKKHGPECTAMFSHGSGGAFFKTMLKGFGSANIAAPSYSQCRGPREEAYMLTYGQVLGSPECTDIENTKCLVLIGCHIGENLHNGQVQEMGKAIENGAVIITVDPRFSTAAGKSKHWLPIRPGTDLALILAWIHVIVTEGLYDKDYVEKYTEGFSKLKQQVADNTPEWAYPITTIGPGLIRETAREMAKNAPATIVHPSRHTTWYGDDTQRVRAIAILNALLGSWGRKGGFYRPTKAKVPKYPIPPFPKPKSTWNDVFGHKYKFASLAIASGICDASIPTPNMEAYFKGWIVNGTNLTSCLPQPEKTIEAIRRLELLVVIDTMPSETAGWADVVLPECTYLERYDDLRISAGREPQIALRMPAFAPKNETKPGWWIAKELGKRLGCGKYFPWEKIEDYLDYRLKQIGSSLEEMQSLGVKTLPRKAPLYFGKGEEIKFNTPSGKIELSSQLLEQHGHDAVPKFTRHQDPPENYYRLLYGRAPFHSFSRTTNNPLLTQLMPENEVWINSRVAKKWGIKNGQYLKLKNQDNKVSNKVKAKVTQRIRSDCVYMVHGFGHTVKKMQRSYLRGANDNELITRVNVDPIMGGTGMRVNFVTFEVEG